MQATARAVFKQFYLYWLPYTTGSSMTHNSVSLVATVITQWADCNSYKILAHMKYVLRLFNLVLNTCANTSSVPLNSNFFLKLEYYKELQNRISDVMAQKKSFGNTKKIKCHRYVNIARSVSTTLHQNNNVDTPHITKKI